MKFMKNQKDGFELNRKIEKMMGYFSIKPYNNQELDVDVLLQLLK